LKYYGVSGGTLITSIEISGNIDNNLSECCEKCKFLHVSMIIKYSDNFQE
jgi:hypothetical protein